MKFWKYRRFEMQDINEILNAAIAAQDFQSIRNALVTFIVQDPGFSSGVLDEKIHYCRNNGIAEGELFDSFDGGELKGNSAEWTKDYYAELRTDFRANLSRERLYHMKKVAGKLYPQATASAVQQNEVVKKNDQTTPQSTWNQPYHKKSDNAGLLVAVAIVAAAVVIGVIAVAIG
jgi:hypothetical protein